MSQAVKSLVTISIREEPLALSLLTHASHNPLEPKSDIARK